MEARPAAPVRAYRAAPQRHRVRWRIGGDVVPATEVTIRDGTIHNRQDEHARQRFARRRDVSVRPRADEPARDGPAGYLQAQEHARLVRRNLEIMIERAEDLAHMPGIPLVRM
jgi:hypothetical protein